MSTSDTDSMGGTKPRPEHQWLKQLVGSWKTTTDLFMPDGSKATAQGTEEVTNLGGLWALAHGRSEMPDGAVMEYYSGTGFDVTFNAYRGFMVMSMSSHLWKYEGALNADGKTMTLDCPEGPNFTGEGTAPHRDVLEIIDADHRTLTTSGVIDGKWVTFMISHYTRV